MTFPLALTDGPCPSHKDCTATTYSNDLRTIGVRHLHQWLDPQGLDIPDGRTADDLAFGTIQIGLLLDYDETTGAATFDADGQAWTLSVAPAEIDPEARLGGQYNIADDRRGEVDELGNYPKLVGSAD